MTTMSTQVDIETTEVKIHKHDAGTLTVVIKTATRYEEATKTPIMNYVEFGFESEEDFETFKKMLTEARFYYPFKSE